VTRRYLRALPLDPTTGAADGWTVVAPPPGEPGKVYDVRSGSTATARDGSAVNTW
jgi:general secretion pathway protein G